jgi:AcrR family transcriptional regulator
MSVDETPYERVLRAAFEEFSARGFAGARIDQIARAARTSKERVYAYFRSKDELHAAVLQAQIDRMLNGVPLDLSDVPRYVGELFDWTAANPRTRRLFAWVRLESHTATGERTTAVLRDKVRVIADAQVGGLITDQIPPLDALILINSLATGWHQGSEYHGLARPDDPAIVAERRAAAVRTARLLFPPTA